MPSQVMIEADVNQDGVLDFVEFVPLAASLLRATEAAAAPSLKVIGDSLKDIVHYSEEQLKASAPELLG